MQIINDVTGLNEVLVASVARPRSTDEIAAILRRTSLPVSIGGGRFSQGLQTASPSSFHIDLSA